jgi:hypothetical protein
MSHCIIRSDRGPAGDIGRLEFDYSHAFSTLNAFSSYNCCKGVAALTKDDLKMTVRERIEAQHPNFVDC